KPRPLTSLPSRAKKNPTPKPSRNTKNRSMNSPIGWTARHYAQAMEKGSVSKYDRDLKLEALAPVVRGGLPVLVFANRARDIRNAVEFCDKQQLKMILAGGAEAYKVKNLLGYKGAPVVLRPPLSFPGDGDDP